MRRGRATSTTRASVPAALDHLHRLLTDDRSDVVLFTAEALADSPDKVHLNETASR